MQIVKMMILIVVIFAVCWLPQHVYFVVVSLRPDVTHHQSIQHVYLVIYWFAMSNAMYNPIVYCWMNARFVHAFQLTFDTIIVGRPSNAVGPLRECLHDNLLTYLLT